MNTCSKSLPEQAVSTRWPWQIVVSKPRQLGGYLPLVSVIAHLDTSGRPWTIPNAEGDILTPSVVFFDGFLVVVGKEAIKAAIVAPEDVAQFIKRDMGCQVYQKQFTGNTFHPRSSSRSSSTSCDEMPR